MGVCMVIFGFGVINFFIGLGDVLLDSILLVCIIGQVVSYLLGIDVFQEMDVVNSIILLIKWNYQIINVEEIFVVFVKVFFIVNFGCLGLVVIDIMKDVQLVELDFFYQC